jgi:nicotinate-nucleotide pyrophosphorylase (carboxylating)
MNRHSYEAVIEAALREDLLGGDLTTDATVDAALIATAFARAKGAMVVCGAEAFFAVFRKLDATCSTFTFKAEGARAARGDTLWQVQGNARALLMAERTALNLAQRLSGIATLTRRFVDALPQGSATRIADTRKTTPGLRALERYAVRTGGGMNHRDSLSSAVLIKDNHIVAAGGVAVALERARRVAPHTSKLEIEVANLEMLEQALSAGADIIMLDNFAEQEIEAAVTRCRGRALVEVSGGITCDRVATLAKLGVDVISVGALTHSAQAADISLSIELVS